MRSAVGIAEGRLEMQGYFPRGNRHVGVRLALTRSDAARLDAKLPSEGNRKGLPLLGHILNVLREISP